MTAPECTVELSASPAGGYRLAFVLRNASGEPLELSWFEPYASFALTVEVDGGEVPVVQPAFDSGVRPVHSTLEPGEACRLDTPFTLVFDADFTLPYDGPATRWTLVHVPAKARLEATLRLGNTELTCCGWLEPEPADLGHHPEP